MTIDFSRNFFERLQHQWINSYFTLIFNGHKIEGENYLTKGKGFPLEMNSEIVVDNLIKGDTLNKIGALNNFHVIDAIDTFVSLCEPSKISIITDSPNEIAYVRQKALDLGEEHNLAMKGHTVHFDGFHDQARDKKHTVILLPNDYKVSKSIYIMDREKGLREVFELLRGSMRKKECFIRFFSLGPTDSRFSLCAIQITDSAYVAHSEDLLYRSGYEQFKKLNGFNLSFGIPCCSCFKKHFMEE